MRIGVCTTDFERRSAESLISTIADMGFENMQFAFCSVNEARFEPGSHIEIPMDISFRLTERISRLAEKFSLPIICVNGTWNMAHPDAFIREEGLRRMRVLVRAAADLGAKYVSICTGSRGDFLWKYSPETETESAYSDAADMLKKSAEAARRAGVTLLIETEASNVARTPETALRMIEESGGGVGIVLDPANLFLPGTARPETARATVANAVEILAPHIMLAHGKDIKEGAGLEFCGAGDGIVDFPDMLKNLANRGIACDMVLHGIYDESRMPVCLSFMRECVTKIAL